MRERKRPDWPQLIYSYRTYPQALPDQLWTTARAMHTLWNRLVDLREETKGKAQGLSKAEAKPLWLQFNEDIRHAAAESPLEWEARASILDRFQTASRRALKERADLRKRVVLDRVMIPHRFTGGGLPIDRFFTQKQHAQRARFDAGSPPISQACLASEERRSHLPVTITAGCRTDAL